MWQAWLLSQWGVALWLNLALVVLGLLSPQKALTRAGVIHAGLLGLLVWGGLGGRGYAVVAAYFLVGTAVTKLGDPAQAGAGDRRKARGGTRAGERLGSALTGAVCALGYAFFPHPLWWLGYSASFAAKLADTVSSEVGKAYGRKTFLITTFQSVPAGTEGAVSLEGSLAGVAAAAGMGRVGLGDWRGVGGGKPILVGHLLAGWDPGHPGGKLDGSGVTTPFGLDDQRSCKQYSNNPGRSSGGRAGIPYGHRILEIGSP
jgi:uncharacterized protein (TIGR00297 family)